MGTSKKSYEGAVDHLIDTWGKGEPNTVGGVVSLTAGRGAEGQPLLAVCVMENTWGFDIAEHSAHATILAHEANLPAAKPLVPVVHLTFAQWQEFVATGNSVFAEAKA